MKCEWGFELTLVFHCHCVLILLFGRPDTFPYGTSVCTSTKGRWIQSHFFFRAFQFLRLITKHDHDEFV